MTPMTPLIPHLAGEREEYGWVYGRMVFWLCCVSRTSVEHTRQYTHFSVFNTTTYYGTHLQKHTLQHTLQYYALQYTQYDTHYSSWANGV